MGITHLSGLEVAGVPTMGINGGPLATGNWFFVDAANGSDGNTGAADNPFATVYWAYQQMVSGHNDVCVVVGSGSTAATQRLSLANALAANSAATSGSLIWAKNACHLIGMTAPTFNARARFAPPTGTYTAATFLNGQAVATTPFVSVTAHGCIFANFSVFCGFSTGDAGMLTWVDTGGENYYANVSFLGLNDAASAAGANARSLVISGTTGENTFYACDIGGDTTTRLTNVNASLEVKGGSPRNRFIECTFRSLTSLTTSLHFLVASGGIDRSLVFKRCTFLNGINSGGATMAVAATVNASAGGSVLLQECASVGSTVYATTGPIYVMGSVPTGATSGLAVAAT
jgi:hypothetical protein